MATSNNSEFEFKGGSMNGFLMCAIDIVLYVATVYSLVQGIIAADTGKPCAVWFIGSLLLFITAIICSCGFSMLEPNEAKVMTFFGKYVGTFRKTGFYWLNPFMTVKNVSLRARNLNADPIKVNDKTGNPVDDWPRAGVAVEGHLQGHFRHRHGGECCGWHRQQRDSQNEPL